MRCNKAHSGSAVCLLALLAGIAGSAWGVRIADITRIGGQRTNILTGLGLVYGLNGTGDGGDFSPAIKPLAAMLEKYGDPSTVAELQQVQNVALVSLIATVPPDGARHGDALDVYIMSLGAASSLRGGRLFVTPMTGPIAGRVLALAQGAIVLEDPATPTVGLVKKGLVMEDDLLAKYIDDGRFTLILDDPAASWANANAIANVINDDEGNGETLAVAVDPKNVVVTIPPPERARPDGFISRVQGKLLNLSPAEARVQINERTGTMILSGEVEISPTVIIHKGLTITTITPPPIPSPRNPIIGTQEAIPLDTTGQGGPKLNDLVAALDQLKVPAADKIEIIKELHKTGRLHAKLVVE